FWKNLSEIIKFVFLCSCLIEFLQLFLHIETFQLSDLFYNTLGGGISGVIYYLS
ncbi:TPA: VanZ family protein, partial [Enterococcus faecium]|nr:VanZ family protein [Enterococcus faecium]HCR3715251.1 VanZ family protein [Enterococcus faecium]